MSASLEEIFDGIFDSTDRVVFIDRAWVKGQSLNYRRLLKTSSKVKHYFQFDAKRLTEENIVSALTQTEALDDARSNYRRTIDILEEKGYGVVVFYQTHSMSSNVLHLVSRVIRSAERQNLDWKFIFLGKFPSMNQLAIDQLFIERFYPTSPAGQHMLSKSSSQSAEPADSKVPLYLFFLLVLLGGLALLVSFMSDDVKVSEQLASEHRLSTEVHSDQSESVLDPNRPSATFLEIIRESKLRDLEFKGMLEQIDSPAADTTSNAENSGLANKVASPATRATSSTKKLPIEVENAIRANDLELLKSLLSGTDLILAQNSNGETPLIIATYNSHGKIMDWLLTQNTRVNTRDGFGRSALFYASINGDDELLARLISVGARADMSSKLLKTPLMAAVHNNHFTSAQMLLQKGSNVNAVDHSGWSALFYSAWNSNLDMVEMLVENGADIQQTDSSGLTARDIAIARGHVHLLDRL